MAYTAIDDPEAYFQVKIWTGNGSTQSITLDGDTDMAPNLVWIKQRDETRGHNIQNSVIGATKYLDSRSTGAESTVANTLTAFNSDGFSIGSYDDVNKSSQTYVAWCWKESATAGFDIVLHTGNGSARTISHSLSAKPDFFVVKGRSYAEQWECYHKTLGATKCLQWDDNSAEADLLNRFNDTEPTSSVFTVGDADAVNKNTYTYVTYLWSGKQGFSKFGSYTGNGNVSGPMIWLGFRPAFVMFKRTDSTGPWSMFDTKRDVDNVTHHRLEAQAYNAEYTGSEMYHDILSNGFKLRTTDAEFNASGGSYIYMAFAEAPFVNSNGVPCNAR